MPPKIILLCVCVFFFFKYPTVSFHTCTRDTAEKSPNKEFRLNGSVLFFMGKNWEKMILCIFLDLFYTKQQSIDYKLPWNNSMKKKYPKVCPFLNIWSERQSLWIYWILHHSCKWSHFIMIRSLSSPRMILQKQEETVTLVYHSCGLI